MKKTIKKTKKKYVNTHIGKGKNSSDNVELRREEFIRLLGSGIPLKQISKILNVSMDTLYKDKQEISKRGLENLRNLGNAELTFYYSSLISNMNNIKRELWFIINNQSSIKNSDNTDIDPNTIVTIDHKLKALRTLMEVDREFRELYKDTINAIIIPDYTKRLDVIESILLEQDNNNNKENKENKIKSFMTLKRPQLTKDIDNNNNDNTNNNDNVNSET